jgi:hypothetical protein
MKDFVNKFDESEDFNTEDMDKFQSGSSSTYLDEDQIQNELERIQRTGSIIELLEPQARSFNNVP